MSKCKVCMSEYPENKGAVCPLCDFDPPYMLGEDDHELLAYINSEKKELLKHIKAEIKAFSYDITENSIDEKGEEWLGFGSITEFDKICWLNEKFETVGTREKIDLISNIKVKGHVFRLNISVPNIKNAQYLCVGISIDESFNISVFIKDQSGNTADAGKTYMFKK